MTTRIPARHIGDAIHQHKPFAGPEHEVYVALMRTASDLEADVAALLREYDLSPAQYNVLRILRGAGDDGLSCGDVADRLVTRDPDMTRLLDRLEKLGLASRARSTEDRRVVKTMITTKARGILARIDGPITELHRRQLGHLGPARLKSLLRLLEQALAPQQVQSAMRNPKSL